MEEKIILTSNYNNMIHGNKISISGDKGKRVNFNGKTLSQLAPKKEFWQKWHDNIGKISEEENTLYYVKEYYYQVLKKLDPELLLDSLPNKTILLCYENSEEFCHRHLVAFWLELFLDINTYEVKELENYKLEPQKRPEYLKDILEQIIKEDIKMYDFNSIKAATLYTASIELEKKVDEISKGKLIDDYEGELMTQAARLRMEADEAEEKYLYLKQQKVKKYTK